MPYKISIWIVLFLLFFNGGAALLDASGTFNHLGVETDPGDDSQLGKAKDKLQGFDYGSGGGSTLFGLYSRLASVLGLVFNSIFPGAAMLKNIGVPGYLVNFIFAGLAVIPGIDLILFLRRG